MRDIKKFVVKEYAKAFRIILFIMEINKFSRPNTLSNRKNPRTLYNTYVGKDQQTHAKTKYNSTLSVSTGPFKCQSVRKVWSKEEDSKINIIKQRCFVGFDEGSHVFTSKFMAESNQDKTHGAFSSMQEQGEVQRRENRQIHLKPSRFKGRPATVYFEYSKACGQTNSPNNQKVFPLSNVEMRYKLHGWQYKCIMNSLEYNGFKPSQSADDWSIYFDIYADQRKRIQNLNKFQKFSHFPGCWYMGRKDSLWRGISKLKRNHPQQYDFVPLTYLLPTDFDRFNLARQASAKGSLWIMKPADSACGRGIRLVAKDTEIKKRKNFLISEYISNPHLINNLKYDLRVYVLVTSYDPLRIYMFQNGLVRFATHQYNCKQKDIKKRFVHLTNYSVNKHSKNFVKNQNEDGDALGSKWCFEVLRNHYERMGIDSEKLFKEVEDVVIKTCISSEPNMLDMHTKSQERRNCCFELYGFDILIDENLKPWLIEVNVCPSLSSSSPMDRKIKHTLITDLLNLIGIQVDLSKQQEKSRKFLKGNFCFAAKKIFPRNLNHLENLSFQNCLQILSPEDWLVLLESEEQLDRTGHFKKIFPLAQNIGKYQHLFESPRYWNSLLWKSIQSPKPFLNRILID